MENLLKDLFSSQGYKISADVFNQLIATIAKLRNAKEASERLGDYCVGDYTLPVALKALILPTSISLSAALGERDFLLRDEVGNKEEELLAQVVTKFLSPAELKKEFFLFNQRARLVGFENEFGVKDVKIPQTLAAYQDSIILDGKVMTNSLAIAPVKLSIDVYDEGMTLPHSVTDLLTSEMYK